MFRENKRRVKRGSPENLKSGPHVTRVKFCMVCPEMTLVLQEHLIFSPPTTGRDRSVGVHARAVPRCKTAERIRKERNPDFPLGWGPAVGPQSGVVVSAICNDVAH